MFAVEMVPAFDLVRNWLEILYFLSGPTLVVVTLLALQQVNLLKKDYEYRVKRAAAEKALEYSRRFADVIQAETHFLEILREANAPVTYVGAVGDFSPRSLTPQQRSAPQARFHLDSLKIANDLEEIAGAFVHGIASSEVGFNIFGRAFVMTVHRFYDLFCIHNDGEGGEMWRSTAKLYAEWKACVDREGMEVKKKQIEQQLEGIKPNELSIIGNDPK